MHTLRLARHGAPESDGNVWLGQVISGEHEILHGEDDLRVSDDQDDGAELAALRELVQSAGWQVLRAYGDKTWGPVGYGWKMHEALATIPAGADRVYEIARVAEQVDATARAVNEIFAYPESRIAQLTTPKASGRPFDALRRMGR